ncbi:hypothetical protein V5O48_011764 [Marasmius crinis-equi]|uniref:F-box protein n=1 Tax=Marasmius crinis-equi TaxID=585013 RepID=A0ABR3F577_9AGAR
MFSANSSNEAQLAREGARPALSSLVAHCERWESVSLTVAPGLFLSSIFDLTRGRLPLLNSLTLDLAGPRRFWSTPFNCFDICPALRSLRIDPDLFALEEVSLPWHQIVSLQMSASFNLEAFPVLSLCPGVECLQVCKIGGQDEDEEDYSGHVVSNRVKTLDIVVAHEQDDIDGVLRHTTLGGTTSLRICGHYYYVNEEWPTWSDTHLLHFLERSSCKPADHRLIPTIKSLCIEELTHENENRIVTKTFLERLAVNAPLDPPSSAPLVPRLTDLKLVVHMKRLKLDPLLKALSSRWLPDPRSATKIGVDCLSSVELVGLVKPGQKGGRLDGLFCFRDAGMWLSITYGSLCELYPNDEAHQRYENGDDEEEEEEEGPQNKG